MPYKNDIKITLIPLEERYIDDAYVSWFDNSDGHLDYYTGSGKTFTREVILEDFKKGKESGDWFYYLIQDCDGKSIGNIKIGPIDHRNKTSDLVCLIGNRNFLGKGIAVKAISLANEIAFKEYDIRRLHSGIYASNIPSIKAYTKAGWFIEATLKGYYWKDGKPEDRICIACLNPKYFPETNGINNHEKLGSVE